MAKRLVLNQKEWRHSALWSALHRRSNWRRDLKAKREEMDSLRKNIGGKAKEIHGQVAYAYTATTIPADLL